MNAAAVFALTIPLLQLGTIVMMLFVVRNSIKMNKVRLKQQDMLLEIISNLNERVGELERWVELQKLGAREHVS